MYVLKVLLNNKAAQKTNSFQLLFQKRELNQSTNSNSRRELSIVVKTDGKCLNKYKYINQHITFQMGFLQHILACFIEKSTEIIQIFSSAIETIKNGIKLAIYIPKS